MHGLGGESRRILPAEIFVQSVTRIGELLALRHQQREIVEQENPSEVFHETFVQIFPHAIAHKEQFGLGVVYDMVNIVGFKLVQNGYRYSPIGDGGKEGYRPVGRVFAADGNLVAFFDTGTLEQQVYLGNFAGYVFVVVGYAVEVAQGDTFPIVFDGLFDVFIKTIVFHI